MGLEDFIEGELNSDTSSDEPDREQKPEPTSSSAEWSPPTGGVKPYREGEGMALIKKCPSCRTECERDTNPNTGEYMSSFSCNNDDCGTLGFFAGYTERDHPLDEMQTEDDTDGFLSGAEEW